MLQLICLLDCLKYKSEYLKCQALFLDYLK
nr:MAG TPA: hypothetical protein [Caudoviricetes sp.]